MRAIVSLGLTIFVASLVGCGSVSGSPDGGGGAPTCGDWASQYQVDLPAAQRCTVGAAGQCAALVTGGLTPCNCASLYVNDATALNATKAGWEQAGCDNSAVACPAIACVVPSGGQCVSADGGGGVCTNVVSGPTP